MRLRSVRWGKRPIPIGIPSGDHSLMTMSSRAGMLYETPRIPQRRPEPVVRTIISRDGEQAMREELSRLRQELESFPERLKESHSFGESKENDDYLQIREEQAVVASRILQLETLLDSSRVVDAGGARSTVVGVGSMARVRDVATDEVREHRLAGGYQPLGPDEISVNSPTGQALYGRAVGDQITVVLPRGRFRVLELVGLD